MMRLIDADALYEKMVNTPVRACQDAPFDADWWTRIADTLNQAIGMVESAPTIGVKTTEKLIDVTDASYITEIAVKYAVDIPFCEKDTNEITFKGIQFVPIRHGRWLTDKDYCEIPTCSVCGRYFYHWQYIWRYCPNCGARMDEVEE